MSREAVTINGKPVLTLKETAEASGMSERWIRGHANGYDFPSRLRIRARVLRWSAADVQAWVDRSRERA